MYSKHSNMRALNSGMKSKYANITAPKASFRSTDEDTQHAKSLDLLK